MPDPRGDTRSDEELVAAIARGDRDALAALYHRYRDWITSLARRFTNEDAAALDVLQETFAYLLRKGPSLHLSARMTTFLYPVVRHLALAANRTRRSGPVPNELTAPGAPADEPAIIRLAVAALPEGQREVILMRFVDDMSMNEIALALGIPIGTVKSRLHNALAALRADPRTARYFGLD